MSSEQGRILYLDGWRGLAILTVMVGHFAPGLEALGTFGVDLFLVLSGRLMANILIEKQFPLKMFFIRRFTRIYPALLVFATSIFIASVVARARGYEFNSLITPLDYLAALTMWMNYKVAFFGEAGAANHLWSISVEEHSYIILAVLAAVASRKVSLRYIVVAIAILALVNGFLLAATSHAGGHDIFWRSDVRIAPLFMSFAVYLAPRRLRRMLGGVSPILLAFAFVVPFLNLSLAIQLSINTFALALSVNGLDGSPIYFRKVIEQKVLIYFGIISYSLYLWQQPFYIMHERMNALPLVVGAFVCALGSFYLVEAPCRKWLNATLEKLATRRRNMRESQAVDPIASQGAI